MRVLEGKLVDSGIKVGIVAARFNEFIVSVIHYILYMVLSCKKDGIITY